MVDNIYFPNPVQVTNTPAIPRQKPAAAGDVKTPFARVLDEKMPAQGVKFSQHAQERLKARGIALSETDLRKLEGAVDSVAQKGGRESLIMLGDAAGGDKLTYYVDEGVMQAAPGLKVISNCAVGVDNVDVAAATKRRIPVGNTPDVLTDATADMAFALLLAAARRVVEGVKYVKDGNWKEEGGKIQMWGTTEYQLDANQIWDKIKEHQGWESEVVADIKAERSDIYGIYEVKPGDTLSKIAKHFLGDANRYQAIFELNTDQLKDPNMIRVGQKLKIPNR